MSQCKKTDKEFYEYKLPAMQFADLMGISPTHIYEEADSITDELMKGFIKIYNQTNGKRKKRGFKNL